MDLKEKLEVVASLMMSTKGAWVATEPENTDLGIYLHFWRGDEMVATVICALERDQALQAGGLAAMGFSASTMSISFESFHSELGKSPLTGKDWVHHEMQYVSETYPDAYERGWVAACITTTIHERGGQFALHSIPYQIHDHQVVWLKEGETHFDNSWSGNGGGGVMYEYLQQAMTGPTIAEKIAAAAEQDAMMNVVYNLVEDEEQRRFHSDMACQKALTEKGLCTAVTFTAPPGSEREQWLTERFGEPEPL